MIYSQTTPLVQLVQEDIDFISQIPILDNEDDTYITDIENVDYIRESYGLSLIDSISLLENVNEISNLSLSIPDWYVYSNPDILTESIQYSIYSTQDDEEDQRLQYIIENYDNFEDIILLEVQEVLDDKDPRGKNAKNITPQASEDKPSTPTNNKPTTEAPKKGKGSSVLNWMKNNKVKTGALAAGALAGARAAHVIHTLRKSPRLADHVGRIVKGLPTNKVSEQIFRLRRLYANYLSKANGAVDRKQASLYQHMAARILTLIDKLLMHTTRATNKVGDAAWSIRKKLK